MDGYLNIEELNKALYNSDWAKMRDLIAEAVDAELVDKIAHGLIVGLPASAVSVAEAQTKCPELSSLNPSRMWSRAQQYALAVEGNFLEAIDLYDNILLPLAQEALIDQQGDLLPNGKTCNFPPSPYAGEWITWCANNSYYAKKNLAEQVYNLNGYKLWDVGEVSTGIFKKRIAVDTTYEGGEEVKHYYPEKNWH